MIRAHLGETIDIHGGGLDLIFPHHENEIAQSRCRSASRWRDTGCITACRHGRREDVEVAGQYRYAGDLLAAGHRGETLRLALLSAHYRQPLAWTEELIAQSKAMLDRWYRVLGEVEPFGEIAPFREALRDDLNTPKAIAVINEFLRSSEQPLSEDYKFFQGGREQMLQAAARPPRPWAC